MTTTNARAIRVIKRGATPPDVVTPVATNATEPAPQTLAEQFHSRHRDARRTPEQAKADWRALFGLGGTDAA